MSFHQVSRDLFGVSRQTDSKFWGGQDNAERERNLWTYIYIPSSPAASAMFLQRAISRARITLPTTESRNISGSTTSLVLGPLLTFLHLRCPATFQNCMDFYQLDYPRSGFTYSPAKETHTSLSENSKKPGQPYPISLHFGPVPDLRSIRSRNSSWPRAREITTRPLLALRIRRNSGDLFLPGDLAYSTAN